jgi:hypothetical protein
MACGLVQAQATRRLLFDEQKTTGLFDDGGNRDAGTRRGIRVHGGKNARNRNRVDAKY